MSKKFTCVSIKDKKPLYDENTVSFFMLAHKQPRATDYCLKTVRDHYPTNKIIVFENGSNVLKNICKKHNAKYIYQPLNYQKPEKGKSFYACMQTLEHFNIFINQHKHACEYLDTKWIIYLEADVIIKKRIEKFPQKSIGGHLHSFNEFNNEITAYINMFRKKDLKKKYIFTCAGGSIINKSHLYTIVENNEWEKYIKYPLTQNKGKEIMSIRCRDAFLSYLFYIYGYETEEWSEYAEMIKIIYIDNEKHIVSAYRRIDGKYIIEPDNGKFYVGQDRIENAAIIHQYKKYYT